MTPPAPQDPKYHERRVLAYQRLLADAEFQEFILKDWLETLEKEQLEKLSKEVDPVEVRAARDVWLLSRELTKHMEKTVEIYKMAEAQRLADEERQKQRKAHGLPVEGIDE